MNTSISRMNLARFFLLLTLGSLFSLASGCSSAPKGPRRMPRAQCIIIDRYIALDKREAQKAAEQLRSEGADDDTQLVIDRLLKLTEEAADKEYR